MKPKQDYQSTVKGKERKRKYRKRKYSKGPQITSVDHLTNLVLVQNKYVYLYSRPMHPKWIMNMTYATIYTHLVGGFFFEAIENIQ